VESYVVTKLLREAPRRLIEATRRAPEAQESLAALIRRAETEEARLRGLADYLTDGTLSKAEYVRQKQRVQERLDKLEQEITRLRAQAPRRRLLGATFEEIFAAWDGMGLEERRLVLADHIERVIVKPVGHGAKKFNPASLEIVWKQLDED
jgi:hypothetical protein